MSEEEHHYLSVDTSERHQSFLLSLCNLKKVPVHLMMQAPESAYAFLRELGRGEYARTWLVKRQSCSREFACKEILKGNTTASYQRARREAEVHSVLNGHPNIAGKSILHCRKAHKLEIANPNRT